VEGYVSNSYHSCSHPHRYVRPKFKKPVAAKAEVSQEQLQQLLNQALLIYLKATSTYMDISEQQ